jgi:uncharacterized membrane protein
VRNHYKKLTFQHANLKRPVSVVAGTISMWHWSEPTKSMIVYTTGGIIPVEETDEQITQMVEALNYMPHGEEKENVPTTTVSGPTSHVRERKARKAGKGR